MIWKAYISSFQKKKDQWKTNYRKKQSFQTVQGKHASNMKQPQMWPGFEHCQECERGNLLEHWHVD